jgi:hypothetical protein
MQLDSIYRSCDPLVGRLAELLLILAPLTKPHACDVQWSFLALALALCPVSFMYKFMHQTLLIRVYLVKYLSKSAGQHQEFADRCR